MKLDHGHASYILSNHLCQTNLITKHQVYDAINEDSKLPNIEYPDTDANKAIIEFHACKYQSYAELFILMWRNNLMSKQIETTNMHQFIL